MFQYHVTNESDKRIVETDSKCRSDLEPLVLREFNISNEKSYLLQYWNDRFVDWTTITDITSLPDTCKLKLIVCQNAQSSPPPPAAAAAALSSSSTTTTTDSQIPQSPMSVHSETGLDSPSATPTSSRTSNHWPAVYTLPPFPKKVQSELQAAQSLPRLDSTTMHLAIRVLFEDMSQYSWYPSAHQYSEVCAAMTRTFPNLRDKVVNHSRGSRPYQTWMSMLTTKFKFERNKLTNVPEIQANRLKFGHVRCSDALPQPTADFTAERCVRPTEFQLDLGEDEASVADHIKAMQDEMKKSKPNLTTVDDRMNRTIAQRRKDVADKGLTMLDILQKYPGLKLDFQVQQDVRRAYSTDHDASSKMVKFFSPSRVQSMLQILKVRSETNATCANVMSAIGKANNFNLDTQQLNCLLLLLPVVFKERLGLWYTFNKVPSTKMPIFSITSKTMDEILYLEEVHLATYLDGVHVTTPTSYLDAVTTLVCMYWTFNVKLPKELNKTLNFLAGHVCQLQTFKASPALQKVLNAIYSE